VTALLDGPSQSAAWWFGFFQAHADQIFGGTVCFSFGIFAAFTMAETMGRKKP